MRTVRKNRTHEERKLYIKSQDRISRIWKKNSSVKGNSISGSIGGQKGSQKRWSEKVGGTSIKTKDKILDLIKANNAITTNEIALAIGVSKKAIEWQLKQLKEEGIIDREGSRKSGIWKIRV